MFGKILNFKFSSVSEAKLAASFCSEKFGSKISEFNIIGINIFISQSGDLNVSIKFGNPESLNNFVGVCTFTYEKEAASTEI